MKTIYKLTLIFFLISTSIAHAQPQAWNWYFGQNAAVNFSSGSPVMVAGCAMSSWEGCATISDPISGNLLFYTDGITVWDRTNTMMPNVNNGMLNGNSSSTQSGVIVPKPGSTTIYYVFTCDYQGGPLGICYSMVDMTLNGGLGDLTTVNTNILPYGAEKITAVKNCNGNDYWVIVHGWNNLVADNSYYAYPVTSTGIGVPVVSNVGTAIGPTPTDESIGYLKASPNGMKLAAAMSRGIDQVQIYDFNSATGAITNPITIQLTSQDGPYGVSFSPNNNVLYFTTEGGQTLYQYDISSGNQATINASQYIVSSGSYIFALQLAIDNKIYACPFQVGFLDVINNPNILGAGCGYVPNAVNLGTGMATLGLPNFVDAFTVPPPTTLPIDTAVCSTPLTLDAGSGATTYLWNTGATTQTISVNAAGTYWVQITGGTTCNVNLQIDTIHVTILAQVVVNLGNDTTLCAGQNLTLDAGNAGAAYTWSTGATTQTISVAATGNYSVTVTAGTCTDRDTINVTFTPGPVVNMGNDTTLCAGQPITLDAGNAGASYQWSTGATTQTISPTVSGSYWVIASNGTCSDRDTLTVTFNALPVVNLGPDLTLCGGQSATLDAGLGTTYLWSDGSTTETITVSNTGNYWVIVQNGTCAGTDTVHVTTATAPTVNLGQDQTLCNGETTTLNAGNPGYSYFWSTAETTQSIQISNSGTYWVSVNNLGCIGFDTAVINISKPIVVSLYDTVICPGEPMTITIDKHFKTYAWMPGGQGTYQITIDQPGTYRVSVTDTNNCPGSGSVFIDEFCPTDLYVPTAFTPNGNKMNDRFMAYGERILQFHMYVFDRWGEVIFESTDISEGWNGRINNEDAAQGTYVYRVDYQLMDYLEVKKYTKYGVVNLIR